MAADVSSTVGYMSGFSTEESKRARGGGGGGNEKPTALVTRDLLGGLHEIESRDLDLDLQVPAGWEKRLDLKSGKIYIQRCNSLRSSPPSSSDHKQQADQTLTRLQDLNFPPSPSKPLLNLFDESCLDLKLMSSPSLPSSCSYQSVCTLDKVKSALEKAEREPFKKGLPAHWRSPSSSSLSPSNSSSSSSIREKNREANDEKVSPTTVAAGCPTCLLYVLISTSNPKCPRCDMMVPLPSSKRPRIDLNMSI
ncbi:uncharacterized protein LOC104451017 [Eucalyptus grandis]|uniref:Uncharacterized protein n=2 Tax=Eucalyptus grandis TaxID=71139 RepID=A0ACC3KQ28_EUCGR|nr:uncharacterized protein LOC104451017 [Eucalyptus grandis]KAK3428409.1 hypothetical protein EUGRSUZ_F04447 [Eucalyptus grandis]